MINIMSSVQHTELGINILLVYGKQLNNKDTLATLQINPSGMSLSLWVFLSEELSYFCQIWEGFPRFWNCEDL